MKIPLVSFKSTLILVPFLTGLTLTGNQFSAHASDSRKAVSQPAWWHGGSLGGKGRGPCEGNISNRSVSAWAFASWPLRETTHLTQRPPMLFVPGPEELLWHFLHCLKSESVQLTTESIIPILCFSWLFNRTVALPSVGLDPSGSPMGSMILTPTRGLRGPLALYHLV